MCVAVDEIVAAIAEVGAEPTGASPLHSPKGDLGAREKGETGARGEAVEGGGLEAGVVAGVVPVEGVLDLALQGVGEGDAARVA